MIRVLVVEDDVQNALVFRKILERRGGFEVRVSEAGDEIVALARSGAVDLILMDVSLVNTRLNGTPVSGLELCRALKDDPATASIPVVLATAHAMRGDAEVFLSKSGADEYVAKPILDHNEFVARIVALARRAA